MPLYLHPQPVLIGIIDAADSLIRTNPGADKTNGFFVSLFIRSASLVGVDEQGQDVKEDPKASKRKHEGEDSAEMNINRPTSKSSKNKKRKKSAVKSKPAVVDLTATAPPA